MSALRYVARRRSNARGFSAVSAHNAEKITDETVQLLLRAHGRALLKRGVNPLLDDQNAVTVHSVIAFQENQLQQQQQQQQQQQKKPAEEEPPKGLDLAILLGSLKNVRGDTYVEKKVDKLVEKAKEKAARRRQLVENKAAQLVVVDDTTLHANAKPVKLETPRLDFHEEFLAAPEKNPTLKPPHFRSKLSCFLERPKSETDSPSKAGDHNLDRIPTSRLSTFIGQLKTENKPQSFERKSLEETQVASLLSSDQDQYALIAAEALDLNVGEASSMSAAAMKNLVRSFSSLDILDGSIKVLTATKDSGFMPSKTTDSLLICLLLKAGDHEKAADVLKNLLSDTSNLSLGILNTLLDAFERAGNLDAVYTLFLDMVERGFRVDADTTERIFSVLLRGGKAQETFTLFQKCALLRLDMRVETCNFLLDCLGKAVNHKLAARAFATMRTGSCPPNVMTFNILIKHYVLHNRVHEARLLFRLMKKYKVVPDGVTFHYLISGFCKMKKKSLARRRFQLMKQNGFKPDPLTYTCLVNMYGRLNEVDKALELFQEMKRTNVPLDTKFFCALLRAVGSSYKPAMAYHIFREMKYLGHSPDLWTYNLLFHALAKTGRRKRAEKAYREMKRDGITPDVYTYTGMIHCLGNAGKTREACNILRWMLRNGREVNLRTWNALLKGLCREDKLELAFRVYADMKSRGFKPDNTTYSMMLDVSISLRETRRVLSIQKDYRESQLQPDGAMAKILQRSITYIRKDRQLPFDASSK